MENRLHKSMKETFEECLKISINTNNVYPEVNGFMIIWRPRIDNIYIK